MIASVPVKWGAVLRREGTVHAWITKESGRRACVCKHTRDPMQDRWSAPVPSLGPLCQACWGRVGHEDAIDLTPLLRHIASPHPSAVPMSELYSRFSFMMNHDVRSLVVRTIVEARLVARITYPGNGERFLALRALREELGR